MRAFALPSLALLAIALYSGVLGFPFLNYDDPGYVQGSARVTSPDGAAWASIWNPRSSGPRYLGQYAPVRDSLFRLEYQLAGPAPAVFHATNLALHLGCTLLLYLLLGALGQGFKVAFLASVLFVVHPLSVEVVAWISGRKDSLGLLLSLLSLLALHRAARRDSAAFAVVALLAWVLAILSKPTYVVLPAVALAIGAAVPALLPARRSLRVIALFGPLGAALVGGAWMASQISPRVWELWRLAGLQPTPWTLGYVLCRAAAALTWPGALAPVHPLEGAALTADHRLAWSLPLVGLVALASWLAVRRHRAGLALLAVTLLPLVPVLNFLPNSALFADRFLYAARIGPSVLVAVGLVRLWRRLAHPAARTALASVAAALGVLLYGSTLLYLPAYSSTPALWERAAAADARTWIAQLHLAGVRLAEHLPEEAMRHFALGLRGGMAGLEPRLDALLTIHLSATHHTCVCRALAAGVREGLPLSDAWFDARGCPRPAPDKRM